MARWRITAWILPDQLDMNHPALRRAEEEVGRENVRVVLVESLAWMRRLPYHRKRQVLLLSASRHFAEELRRVGFAVDVERADDSKGGLARHLRRRRPSALVTVESTEYGIRRWQLGEMGGDLGLPVEVLPNEMFLVGRFNPIPDPDPGRFYKLEFFYRAMRTHFGLLVEADGSPSGGKWNYDAENRRPLPGGARPPEPARFEPDEITRSTIREVEASGFGVGSAEGFDLPVTRAGSASAFDPFLRDRLPDFGTYEDAMARESGVLYHSKLSPSMNLGLLDPLEMARAVEREYLEGRAPLNSAEGFIRQVIGWREFVYWQYRRQMPGLRSANAWEGHRPMPRMFWDGETEMECVRSVVSRLIDSGYTHHIERLMVVCNFCLLAGIDPAAVADWFLALYVDSHEWVVLPNVIGMGLNADGGLTATKPYISSANYLKRMGDFCGACRYRADLRTGEDACPFNALYWNFLIEHEQTLRANPRLGPAVLGLSRIGEKQRGEIRKDAGRVLDAIDAEPTWSP